jgi:hypothetical protein
MMPAQTTECHSFGWEMDLQRYRPAQIFRAGWDVMCLLNHVVTMTQNMEPNSLIPGLGNALVPRVLALNVYGVSSEKFVDEAE